MISTLRMEEASEANSNHQIIPFPLVGNTTVPLNWVEEFKDLVAQFSSERMTRSVQQYLPAENN
jgi:hypothetical protein